LPRQSGNDDNKQHGELDETHGVLVVELALKMVDDIGEGGEVGWHNDVGPIAHPLHIEWRRPQGLTLMVGDRD
jgi:hypothetical protein